MAELEPSFHRTQSYDNQLILTLISAEGERAARDDRLGFLRLVNSGFIQVGLTENGPAADPPDGERYTLMNMFRTSIANRSFVLSGWPELNDNADLRSEVLDCLNRSLGQRMSAGVPPNIAARIEGLREFDRVLRTSPQGIVIVRQAVEPLEGRVRRMLQTVDSEGDSVRHAAAEIIRQAKRDSIDMQKRSHWYRLIDLNSRYPYSPEASALRILRDIVDLNYNAMINESLSDDGMSLSAEYDNVAETAAREFTPGQSPGRRWADLNLLQGQGHWLRWSDMPQLLSELQVLSPDMRLRELEHRRIEQVAKWEEANSWGPSIRVALPVAAGSAITNFTAALLTASPGVAAGVGGLFGTATLIAAVPVVRALKERHIARLEQRLISRDERSTIRTSAANWLEGMRRPE